MFSIAGDGRKPEESNVWERSTLDLRVLEMLDVGLG